MLAKEWTVGSAFSSPINYVKNYLFDITKR